MNIRELSYLDKLSTDKSSFVSGAESYDWYFKGSRYECTNKYQRYWDFKVTWKKPDQYGYKGREYTYYCDKVDYYNNNNNNNYY